MRISKRSVDQIVPPHAVDGKPKQAFYRDSTIPGFGLRVSSGGTKSFILETRIAGAVKRITLGRYGQITVEQARKEAMRLHSQVANGVDPRQEKRAAAVRQTTLEDTLNDYLKTRKDLKPSTVHDYERAIQTSLSDWLHRPLLGITKDMVEQRHHELGKRSHARANNTMRVLRALFNHAIAKYETAEGDPIIQINPVNRLSETRAWFKVERRQTLIQPHQLASWYQATLQLNNLTTRDYLHLLLLTGLRRSEGSRLRWDDIDFESRTLTVEETKNHQPHTLPLSDYLYDLLQCRHEERTSPYVFPSESERGYLIEPRTAISRVAKLSGVPFTLHDLRRTFITIAESLDIPGYALKRLLNHRDPNDVTAGYIVSNVDRLRGPMQKITNFVIATISSGTQYPNGRTSEPVSAPSDQRT